MFISMEMPPLDICRKFLMLHKRIEGEKLDWVLETSPIMSTVDEGLKEFKGDENTPWLPIYLFNGTGEISLKVILDVCRTAKEIYWVELVVIDHLHYFANSTGNRAAEVANSIRKIKSMAMELDLPILLLAHLNRAWRALQRKGMYIPSLADLKDAGAIEQDADQVLFVCRDSESHLESDRRKTILKVAKNRDGKTWHISMDFNMDVGVFSEMPWEDYLAAMMQNNTKSSSQASVWVVEMDPAIF